MQYRKFGSTDLMVSEIGFGAWAIGGPAMIGETAIGWGATNDNDSIEAIHRSVEAGINFFDTADIYGLGHSEDLLGKTIGNDPNILIATKVGNVARNNSFTVDYSGKHIQQACEASLRRLRRDVIDYYQLHTARIEHMQQDCLEVMQSLQQQGKIRYWGISLNTFDPAPEADHLLEKQAGQGLQLVFNLINHIALPVIKRAAEKGYGIIARMPLQFGLLTGKFDNGHSFPNDDHRSKRLGIDVIEATRTSLFPVWALCEKYNCNKTQLALSFILSYPQVSTVIPGIRTADQVSSNSKGLFILDPSDIAMIEQLGSHEFLSVMELIRSKG